MIDGVNGLACGAIIIVASATFFLGYEYREPSIQILSFGIISSVAGIFVLNYPAGKIFLGDAGAYTFGFLIGIILITLKYKHPEISGWSFVLILFWPVTETSHSIFRRMLKRRSSDKPDMMHMHHLIMRTIENMSNKKVNRKISNPLSTAVILPLASAPVLVAITFPEADLILALMAIGFWFLFSLTYLFLYRLNRLRASKYNMSVSKILGI